MNTDVARAIAIRASAIHKENRFNINVVNELKKEEKKQNKKKQIKQDTFVHIYISRKRFFNDFGDV